tara:strand:- start:4371 stop:4682 length:312 start_codon:yes stop_codon:yes gene_type:complete
MQYLLLTHFPGGSGKKEDATKNKENTSMSNYYNEKSTARFTFGMSRNQTAKKAGSNVVTISTNPRSEGGYSVGQLDLTMTVKEAKALQSFLNDSFEASESVDI